MPEPSKDCKMFAAAELRDVANQLRKHVGPADYFDMSLAIDGLNARAAALAREGENKA